MDRGDGFVDGKAGGRISIFRERLRAKEAKRLVS